MGVIFSFHWQAKVEHVADRWHVNTACCHVGCDQNLNLTFAQSLQAAVTDALVQSAVQSNRAETFLLQVVGQAIALDLCACKHDGLLDVGVAQPVVEQLAFVLRIVGPEQRLLDVLVLVLRAVDGDTLWLTHHTASELLNTWCKSRAEHHGLLAAAGQLVDFSEVVREAQIEHTVGFVNDQEFHFVELQLV